ncbi:carbohydrate-binding module family 50 protein [Zasmidium cellare ATCC 36951]|uniref:Carbohydrate-binding module family 50 protein n=1 Tax=Zasmidium cellare ATCC 36951 TaxID=1080233 RepID=A0A6A6C1H7_ZASCE|nr:carbohydrate-binding module family 50 protein [Zasmidium cellare ATCC 36951]KAF2160118.1 carbohydrate-binding module family 50 protein [Zasmidium cellare ATCC 36951]
MAFKRTLSALALAPHLTSALFLNTTRSLTLSTRSFLSQPSQSLLISSSDIRHAHGSLVSISSAPEITITANSTQVPFDFHRLSSISCSFETSADAGDTCESFSAVWGLTVEQFVALNPGVTCPNLVADQSYCVIGTVSPGTTTAAPATTTPTTTPFPTQTTPKPTTTTSAQHQPQQSGLAADCNNFYLVSAGDTCSSIEGQYGIPAHQFGSWNPSIDSDCSNLLAGYYVCVGVPGATTTPPSKTTEMTSKAGNGITTPTPTQSGMADNCNKFDLVESGDSCGDIATTYNIPLATFYSWNPAVGSDCSALWAGYYVCVDTTSYRPTTTTSAGNGITTPTPYESGMVDNCNKFYEVQSGDTCDSIGQSQGVTTADIESWNPKVGSTCSSLYLNYYICVGIK